MAYSPELYMHELDRKALDALNTFPKLVKLQKAYSENVDEKVAKIELLSSAIRLGKNQLPEIYMQLPPICEKLGIDVPELYMTKSYDKKDINAATFGTTNPVVYVTSELVKQFEPEMIGSVLAHECGHIACRHTLYHMLAGNFVQGIDRSPLARIPAIRRHITPALVKALLFWDRCSELSADRAAVLCDGDPNKTIDMLLKVHGFDDNINRDEFINQAMDLKSFINDSEANQLINQMLNQWDSHPMLAARAYEIHDWESTDRYKHIVDGTINIETVVKASEEIQETEVINADVQVGDFTSADVPEEVQIALEERLQQVNAELEKYTNYADGPMYLTAIACGLATAICDITDFKDAVVSKEEIGLSHKQVNQFIQKYAAARGFDRDRLKDAISDLEKAFKVAQDNAWSGANIGVSAKNHHLADLAHHPTPLGLASAMAVQFLRIGTFVNKDGEWHFRFVETSGRDLLELAVPAVITGILNWLVAIAEGKYEEETGKELPQALHKIAHMIATTPEIIQIVKCADNWFGHLVSDMGGSKNTAGEGMGIPGVFLSLMYEIAALPGVKETGLLEVLNDLYVNKKINLRHELAYMGQIKFQAENVMFNEIMTRTLYMILSIARDLIYGGFKNVNWRRALPFSNRSVDRMLAISFMTFNMVDTADAAFRAAVESSGSWVIFSGKFAARYNYVGAGRAALAIAKEFSNEKKEAQLLHERMLLMEAKASLMYHQLQEFKAKLEEKLTTYLAEDIETFMEGFDYINEGLASGDSNTVIKGNVIIQKVLGREPQFETQEEFDSLMDSEEALKL